MSTLIRRAASPADLAAVNTLIRSDLAADTGASMIGSKKNYVSAVARLLSSALNDWVSVFDFMTPAQIADVKAGTHSIAITAAVQAAVTAVCGASKTLWMPAGVYVLTPVAGTAILFPNTSFKVIGEGPSDTAISLSTASITDRIFDFTNCNGPEKVIENISLNGQIGSGSTTSVAAYADAMNGLVFRGVWFRGVYAGSRKTNQASYWDMIDCVFEYCTTGIHWDDAVQCSIQNPVFYRNVTDAYFTGDLDHLVADNWRCANTNSFGVRFVGASNARITNVSFRQDFAAFTPELLRFEGASNNNHINGATTKGFGRVLVSMAGGATCTGNRVSGIRATGAIPAAIEVGAGNTGNVFEGGVIDGVATGIVDAGGGNMYLNLTIRNCTTAGIQQANCTDNEFGNIKMAGNAIDWVTTGAVPTTWLDEIDTTMLGLTSTRIGSRRAGIYGRTFYGSAVPATLAYLRGDRVINVSPSVGQPKAWMCSAAGTPGTWVSEGAL